MSEWPAAKVEHWSIDRLIPYARNARTHSEAQVAQIAASIREWGWTSPLLCDEAGMIIAGHGRVLAARLLGITEVPVIVARDWSEAQKRAYVIADNQLALNAGWDQQLLGVELSELRAMGANLTLIGFDENELAKLLSGARAGLTDPDEVPDVLGAAVSRPGEVWVLDQHRIVCGDSTDAAVVASALDGKEPLLMITDPPYGVKYDPKWRVRRGVSRATGKMGQVLNDDRADWREAWALFPGITAYVWCASLQSDVVIVSLETSGLMRRSQIIWVKDRFTLGRGDYHWQHEPCWYCVRDGATSGWRGGRSQSTVWNIPAREDSGHGHGTQKPIECMRRPIENHSAVGELVYDPFLGSGTTLIAAEMSGRRCHAIELSSSYVDVAIRRWEAFTGKRAQLEATGQSFEQVAAERCVNLTEHVNGAARAEA